MFTWRNSNNAQTKHQQMINIYGQVKAFKCQEQMKCVQHTYEHTQPNVLPQMVTVKTQYRIDGGTESYKQNGNTSTHPSRRTVLSINEYLVRYLLLAVCSAPTSVNPLPCMTSKYSFKAFSLICEQTRSCNQAKH